MHNQMKADHDDLRLLIEEFVALLSRNTFDCSAELLRARTRFSKRFRQHLALEDAELRARATDAQPALREACERHAQKQRAFFLAYSDHIKRWTPETITAEWGRYRADVINLAQEHREMMDWEERELHPLLSHAA